MPLTLDQLREEAARLEAESAAELASGRRKAFDAAVLRETIQKLEEGVARVVRTGADMGTVDLRVLAMAKANQTSHGDHPFVAWLYAQTPPQTVSGWAKDHGYPRGRVQQWVRRNKSPRDAALLIERESGGAVKADLWSEASANERSR